jgi:hypothetical protein
MESELIAEHVYSVCVRKRETVGVSTLEAQPDSWAASYEVIISKPSLKRKSVL